MLIDECFLEEYRTGTNNFIDDFYKKAFSKSVEYWRAVGYFRSSSFEAFGITLQNFLKHNGMIKLITSIELTKDDIDAINQGLSKQQICENRIQAIIENEFMDNDNEGIHRLIKLLEINRLEIKIALPKNGHGIYHEKVGLFFDENNNYIAFSGSANESYNAFTQNYECIDVLTSWDDKTRALKKKKHFEALWSNKNDGCLVFDFPDAFKDKLIKQIQTPNYFESDNKITKINNAPHLPDEIQIRDYQKEAYIQWKNNNFHGILSMATGTGKTITAFNAIVNLGKLENQLAILVVVPYQHLVTQWQKEAISFNIDFILCFENSKKWSLELSKMIVEYQYKQEKYIFIITTTSTYISKKFQNFIKKLNNLCIIVDEAHNFGSNNIKKHYIENATFRLGLSATPIRHMDEEGTECIFSYLGKIVYEFSLEKAIKMKMLTPYKYYPVLVNLTVEEQSEYVEISNKISKMFSVDDKKNKDILKILLIKRAKIISSAKNKIIALKETLKNKNLIHSSFNLFYCSSNINKNENEKMKMVDKVYGVLEDLGMRVEKFTSMDSKSKEERVTLISHLKQEIIDGLVAIKCLDEGVDIPSVKRAFILSSSTNPKEFIQRRGRVLRKSKGKEFAEIYDFLVVPSGYSNDRDYQINKKYFEKELIRYREFAKIALNYPECEENIIDIMSEYHLLYI